MKNTLITLATCGVLALPVCFDLYVVQGVSMEPTYAPGSVVLVEKVGTYLGRVERGAVLVIHNPHDRAEIDIKRVIGLSGEKVYIRDSEIRVVGVRDDIFGPGSTLGREDNGDDFFMQLGPEDYFVLGDNRAQSTDSRQFGAVQRVDIIGRVIASW